MTTNPSTDRSLHVPQQHPDSNDLEYEEILVWPDEIRIGDIYGGYVVTGIHTSEHYRSPAVRLTIFTDPTLIPESADPEEFGRFVLRTDRSAGHRIPIERPIR